MEKVTVEGADLAKEIAKKKTEIRKLQALYESPKSLPSELKLQVAAEIENKKNELKDLYNSPKDIITLFFSSVSFISLTV